MEQIGEATAAAAGRSHAKGWTAAGTCGDAPAATPRVHNCLGPSTLVLIHLFYPPELYIVPPALTCAPPSPTQAASMLMAEAGPRDLCDSDIFGKAEEVRDTHGMWMSLTIG